LQSIGAGLSDYGGFVLTPSRNAQNELLGSLKEYMKSNRSSIVIESIPVDSLSCSLLRESCMKLQMEIYEREISRCPILKIEGSNDEVFGRIDGKLRKNLRRTTRLAEREIGPLTLRQVKSSDEVNSSMDLFWKLREKRTKSEGRIGVDRPTMNFLNEVCECMADQNWSRIYFLEANGLPLSSCIAFEYDKTLSLYQIAHDPTFSKYSPGNLLIYHLIGNLVERNFKMFDFLRGVEWYKLQWSQSLRRNSRVVFTACNRLSRREVKYIDHSLRFEAFRKARLVHPARMLIEASRIPIHALREGR
jgi:CelD/BcsL family acetyltransferase involved in cellulose biosynthesis